MRAAKGSEHADQSIWTMKKLVIILSSTLVLLIGVLLIAPSFIDWSEYRGVIADAVRSTTGREVEFGGDISFRILPSPALSAEDVRIANIPGGRSAEMLTLDSLDIRVAFLPLLGLNVELTSIVLESPQLSLERLADGRTNWDFSTGDEADQGGSEESAQEFSLNQLVIHNGLVSYIDMQTGQTFQVSGLNADLSARSAEGPFEFDGSFISNGYNLDVNAAVGRLSRDGRTAARATVGLGDGAGTLDVNGSFTDNADGFSASGQITGRAANLQRLAAALTANSDEPAALPDSFAKEASFDGEFTVADDSFKTDTLEFSLGDSKGQGRMSYSWTGEPAADIQLSLNSLDLDNWLPPASEATETAATAPGEPASFTLPADVNAQFLLEVGAVRHNEGLIRQLSARGRLADGEVTVERVGASLPGGSTLALSGLVTAADNAPRFEGRVDASSSNLRGLLDWLTVDTSAVPSESLANFSLGGALRLTPDIVQVYGAEMQLDISKATGGLSVAIGRDRPTFGLELDIDRFNADSYMAAAEESESPNWDENVEAFRAALKPLADLDANLDIKIAQFSGNGANLSGAHLVGQVVGGEFALEQLQIDNFEGLNVGLTGAITSLAAQPQLDLTMQLSADSLAPFARWAELDMGVPPENLSAVTVSGRVETDLDSGSVDLDVGAARGTLKLVASAAGLAPEPQTFDATLTLDHFDYTDLLRRLMPDVTVGAERSPLAATMTLKGSPETVSFEGEVGLLGGKSNITGTLDRVGEPRRFELTTTSTFPSFRQVVRAAGQDFDPSGNLGGLTLDARVAGTETVFNFERIAAEIGDTTITGNIAVDRSNEVSVVTGSLSAGPIVIDDFMQPQTAGLEEAASGGERWSKQRLDLSGLKSFAGEISLKAEEIRFRTYRLVSPSLTLKLADGVLTIPDLATNIFGGNAQASASLDARGVPAINVDYGFYNVEAGAAFGAVAGLGTFSGPMTATGSFAGTGNSQFEIISSLDGQGHIEARNGTLNGLNIGAFISGIRELRQSGGGFNLLTLTSLPNRLRGGRSVYRSITTDIVIRDGIMTTQNFAADVEQASLDANAQVNLPAWTLQANAELLPFEPENAKPIRITVNGSVSDPRVRTDAQSMISALQQLFSSDILGGRRPETQPDGTAQPETPQQETQPQDKLLKDVLDLLKPRQKQQPDEDKEPPPGP